MTYMVQFADLQGQDVAVVKAHVPTGGLPDFLGPAFGEVARIAGEQGLQLTGPPFGRYQVDERGEWSVEAGFPVSGKVAPSGRVEADRLPVGRAARTLHVGAYDEVGQAYEAAESFITENGYETSGQPWEFYLDGPEVAKPRTEVFVPCRELRPGRQAQPAGRSL